MLARKLYFSPLYHISDTAYVLDLRKPGISKIVRNFQEYLKQKALRANLHEEKADSETERKPAKLVDISRQNGTDQKSPSRSRSPSNRLLASDEK
jgi:ATPase subunit of ABC transporter with duplicated ATPase domains